MARGTTMSIVGTLHKAREIRRSDTVIVSVENSSFTGAFVAWKVRVKGTPYLASSTPQSELTSTCVRRNGREVLTDHLLGFERGHQLGYVWVAPLEPRTPCLLRLNAQGGVWRQVELSTSLTYYRFD